MTDPLLFVHRVEQEPRLQWALAAGALVLLHAWAFFKGTYGAQQWALKPQRPKALRALAYAAALPVRVLLALFSGAVATLVWALLLGGAWALWKTLRG